MDDRNDLGRAARALPPQPKAPAAVLALAAAVLLGGCAHGNERQSQQALSGLQHALAGAYSSRASATGSTTPGAAGGTTDAVSLTVSPITAQLIGDAVFFVRETPADNPQLVLWQGLWTLAPLAGASPDHAGGATRIVQHSFLFKDARRWAAAGSDPDVLVSVLPQDLQALPGCDLIWQQTDSGYETMGAIPDCHPGIKASGLWMAQHARLDASGLSLTERPVDDAGALDLRAAPLSLHLARSGSP